MWGDGDKDEEERHNEATGKKIMYIEFSMSPSNNNSVSQTSDSPVCLYIKWGY